MLSTFIQTVNSHGNLYVPHLSFNHFFEDRTTTNGSIMWISLTFLEFLPDLCVCKQNRNKRWYNILLQWLSLFSCVGIIRSLKISSTDYKKHSHLSDPQIRSTYHVKTIEIKLDDKLRKNHLIYWDPRIEDRRDKKLEQCAVNTLW